MEQRWADLEKKLSQENCSQEKKNRQLQTLGRKESQYLRLRRTRLGLDDFNTVKVIGKGAFGEVTAQRIKPSRKQSLSTAGSL